MKVVAYYRSSTDLQDSSVPTQQSEVRKYAIDHGLFLDDEYPDPAISARKLKLEDRPQMWRLVQDIEAGVIHTLLVYKRDRLARNAEEYLRIYEILKQNNVNVIFTADNEFPMIYSPIGEFFELFMAGVIEREGDQIAERIRATRLAKFAEGNYATRSPYGYNNDKTDSRKPFERVESELKAVRRIFELVLSDTCKKISDVCKVLTKEGYTRVVMRKQDDGTRQEENSPFEYGHVTGIITNPIYIGEHVMRFSGEVKRNTYDGLGVVTYEEWMAAQERLEMMITRRESSEDSTKRVYLLEGLLWCEKCGAKLKGHSRQRDWETVHMYECPNDKGIKAPCDEVEAVVTSRVREMLDGLMTVHFHQLINRYVKDNKVRLENLIQSQKRVIEVLETKTASRVRRLLRTDDEKKRLKTEAEIVDLNAQTEAQQQELLRLENKLARLESTVPHAKEMRQHFVKMDAHLATPEILKELVYRVELGPYELNIQLRHPFLEVGEVLSREA